MRRDNLPEFTFQKQGSIVVMFMVDVDMRIKP